MRKHRGAGRPHVGIPGVLAGAARAGQRYWWRIIAVAIVVSIVAVLVEIVADEFIDRANVAVSALGDLAASGVSLIGTVFLAGFLSKLVGSARAHEQTDKDTDHHENGADDRISIRQVLRTLPWWRLIGADLLVALIAVVGLLLLIIPGLIAVNLLAVVGPVIEIENRRVRKALRRSAHLVRQHFWAVALLVTLPVAVASEIDTAGPEPHSAWSIIELLAIRGIGGGLIEAVIGLITVNLCLRLMILDRERPASPQPAKDGSVS